MEPSLSPTAPPSGALASITEWFELEGALNTTCFHSRCWTGTPSSRPGRIIPASPKPQPGVSSQLCSPACLCRSLGTAWLLVGSRAGSPQGALTASYQLLSWESGKALGKASRQQENCPPKGSHETSPARFAPPSSAHCLGN